MHIIGVADLTVEMDAQYVRGMLANPNLQPSAAINRWSVVNVIQVFDFKHVYMPAERHQGPGPTVFRGVSPSQAKCLRRRQRRPRRVGDILSLALWLDTWVGTTCTLWRELGQ
jgi:hypothetical protein